MKYYEDGQWKDIQVKVANAIQNEYGESNNDGYSQNYLNDKIVNVGNEVDSKNRVNVLKSKNLFGSVWENGDLGSNGVPSASSQYTRTADYLVVKPSTQYTLKISASNTQIVVYYYSNGTFLNREYVQNSDTYTFTTPANCNAIKFRLNGTSLTLTNTMLNEGSTALSYEPYVTPSINVDGEEIYSKEEILFSGNQSLSMSSTTLTLNKNITDYNLIEIYYTKYSGSDSILSSLKIAPINNGYISPQILFKATSNIIQQFWCLLKITTNAITLQDIGYVNYKISDNSVEVANNTGSFSIVKVIGYGKISNSSSQTRNIEQTRSIPENDDEGEIVRGEET